MAKLLNKDNAADRISYVGSVFDFGSKQFKLKTLKKIKPQWAKLHNEGYIHIHDLDAYGLTYNCLTFNLENFPLGQFRNLSDTSKIVCVFDFVKEMLAKMGNEQSGGMAFANFDIDFAEIFQALKVDYKKYKELFSASIRSMILWCNNIHTRMGKTSYYVSFNIGLGKTDFARFLSLTLLNEFYKAGELVYKPNIIFKVAKGFNRTKKDKNYDLLKLSLKCTSKKMIPTYLLCDCKADKDIDPHKLSIMGCRTRVVADIFGEVGAIGRGNIDNISINLPRLALESKQSIDTFKKKFIQIANETSKILIHRYNLIIKNKIDMYPNICQYKLWCRDITKVGLKETFKHGTLSIGFIGLSEAFEILTGKKYWSDKNVYNKALAFVKFMRSFTDGLIKKHHLNFSLLATSGELISGRFVQIDRKLFKSNVFKKGYYTNSFHIDVDSKLPAYKKLELEGPFHLYPNGGCISYVELKEAPFGNIEGLMELLETAIKSGVHYFGFNFPLDICMSCNVSGTFDVCPSCKSKKIKRIRRVSGYLEEQDSFTFGKMNESKNRKAN